MSVYLMDSYGGKDILVYSVHKIDLMEQELALSSD